MEETALLSLTDRGNVDVLVRLARGRVIYVAQEDQWYRNLGSHWTPDATTAYQLATEVADVWRGEATKLAAELSEGDMTPDVKEQRAERLARLRRHAVHCEAQATIRAMVGGAKADPRIRVDARQLDLGAPTEIVTPRECVAVAGRTVEVRPHIEGWLQEAYPTRTTALVYNEKARCPRWLAFLDEILPDEAVRSFVHRAIGYSASASTSEQVWFLAIGGGANGKSVLLDTVAWILGDYAWQAPDGMFTARHPMRSTFDLACMRGVRFVQAPETGEDEALAEGTIKQLTGGGTVTARPIYGTFFSFTPVAKLWLLGQHRPRIRGQDHGTWRRIMCIPFEVTIPPERQDRNLSRKLALEGEGILRWIVEGMQLWLREGLCPPDSVRWHVAKYKEGEDEVALYVADRCRLTVMSSVESATIYADYRQWHFKVRMPGNPKARQEFLDRLGALDVRPYRAQGVQKLRGIGFKRDAAREVAEQEKKEEEL